MFKSVINLRNKLSYKFVIISIFLLQSCTENSNTITTINTLTGKKALIIFVENNDGLLNSNSSFAFEMYKPQMLDIFSEIFNVEKSKMEGMSLNNIIEIYGEPWQIQNIRDLAKTAYDTIITAHNSDASYKTLQSNLKNLTGSNFTIDLIFCLHGSSSSVWFSDGSVKINNISQFISENKIRLRILYQTCCYAGLALDVWSGSGINAVNGSMGVNSITLFSPGYFIEEWAKGVPYDEAVNNAFNRDIQKIQTYNNKVPVIQYLLTSQNLQDSRQMCAGKNTKIKIQDLLY